MLRCVFFACSEIACLPVPLTENLICMLSGLIFLPPAFVPPRLTEHSAGGLETLHVGASGFFFLSNPFSPSGSRTDILVFLPLLPRSLPRAASHLHIEGKREGPHLRKLPGVGAAEKSRTGAEADGSPATEDMLRDRPVQRQHRQLIAYFH